MTAPPTVALENARYDGNWYYCWLIERRDEPRPRWLGEYAWETDASKAIWYSRKSDAEKACSHQLGGVPKIFVCEHGFMLATPKPVECEPAPLPECGTCGGSGEVARLAERCPSCMPPIRQPVIKLLCSLCGGTGEVNQLAPNLPPVSCPLCQPSVAEGERVSMVAGDLMGWSIAGFQQHAEALLRDEQEKVSPNNALIAFICEAVRLSREYSKWAKGMGATASAVAQRLRTAQPAAPSAGAALTDAQREACEAGAKLALLCADKVRSAAFYERGTAAKQKLYAVADTCAGYNATLRDLAQRGR